MAGAGALYSDFTGLNRLKVQAREGQASARTEVSKQFESVLLGQMIKSMRSATGGTSLLDSKQSLFYRDMQDQQLATQMSKSGGVGLAKVIERQLGAGSEENKTAGRQVADYRASPVWSTVSSTSSPSAKATGTDQEGSKGEGAGSSLGDTAVGFLRQVWPHAERAASALGVATEALVAQAALETGWGKHIARSSDGTLSYNLFGIKADSSWAGDLVQTSTLEYKDGVAVKTRSAFRAYDSFEDSFTDYVDFLKSNRRYEKALSVATNGDAYVEELQRAGYATDPSYAAKLKRIMNSDDMAQARAQLKGSGSRPI